MAIFRNTANTAKKPATFADALSGIKEVFRKAYTDAENLNEQIKQDIQAKTARIEILQTQLSESERVKSETQEFMKNIEKFI